MPTTSVVTPGNALPVTIQRLPVDNNNNVLSDVTISLGNTQKATLAYKQEIVVDCPQQFGHDKLWYSILGARWQAVSTQ